MEIVPIPKVGVIQFKTKLSEITLKEYRATFEKSSQLELLMEEIEEKKLIADAQGEDSETAEIGALYEWSLCALSLLETVTTEKTKHLLKEVPLSYIPNLLSMLHLTDKVEDFQPGITLTLSGVNEQQIKDLKEELSDIDKNIDPIRYHELSKRIERLKKHELILQDVAESAFAAFVFGTRVRQTQPETPKELTPYFDAGIKSYSELKKALQSDKSIQEISDAKTAKTLMHNYCHEIEKNNLENLHKLISLILIPPQEPFSLKYADARAQKLEDAPMSLLLPLINFILAALRSSKRNSA